MSESEGSLKGQFLIAGKGLRDPNFFRAVVLMVEHGSGGAMGLIVNHPSSVSLARALSEHFDIPESDELVFVGGPVEPAALFVLHTDGDLEQADASVVPGVFVGSSPDIFERVVEQVVDGNGDLSFRVFSGCAGWSPGQLEDELARGDWHLWPASAEGILPEDPYMLWDELVELIHASNRTHPSTPGRPEWN